MNTKGWIVLLFLSLILAGCRPAKPTFEISGSPDPLFYGCGPSVLTLTVTGPGEGLKINSIIAAYQLFDGAGKKVYETTLYLHPIPYATPISYDADRLIVIPDTSGSPVAPDEAILEFGEGRLEFAATVYAKILSPSLTGPDETYYFTSTKSIPVLPCTPPRPIPPTLAPTLTPTATIVPEPTKKPKEDSGGAPPAPPSCSAEPNNPNCVP